MRGGGEAWRRSGVDAFIPPVTLSDPTMKTGFEELNTAVWPLVRRTDPGTVTLIPTTPEPIVTIII